MRKVSTAVVAVLLGSALALSSASPGVARDDEMRRHGPCTGPSDWRLEVRREDARTLRVRFRIDHGPAGATWELFLSDNGARFFAGTRTSDAGGEVRVARPAKDRAGTDRIKAYGYSRATGEVCSGSLPYDR